MKKYGIVNCVIGEGVRDLVFYGTEETICRIVETYSDMLLRLAATRLNSTADAEDTVQEVFLYLLKSGITFRDAEHEKAWLIRTTLHRAVNLRKRAESQCLPLDETVVGTMPAPENGNDLIRAVRALPEKYSAVIHLHYYEGYTIREIGKALGVPAATIGTRLARGKKLLRQMLKEDM